VPNSARSARTIRTAAAFSSGLYLRLVGLFPDDDSVGIPASSFPRSGASGISRAFQWIGASVLFGVYVANFGSYNKTYGALAGVIVFLLWLWITNLALLFGAELDAELERGRELRAGLPAERELQLRPRDTRVSDKRKAAVKKAVERARRLRRSRSGSTSTHSPA